MGRTEDYWRTGPRYFARLFSCLDICLSSPAVNLKGLMQSYGGISGIRMPQDAGGDHHSQSEIFPDKKRSLGYAW